MKDTLFIFMQYLLPQHWLSRAVAVFANSQFKPIKNLFIKKFIRRYQVDLKDAIRKNARDYHSFNDFFTRQLTPESRPIDPSPLSITSPADGCISQLGPITDGKLIQAKGRDYALKELLIRQDKADAFLNGQFATIYLSPRDYHRVHMPFAGKLNASTYVPGDLFSVNKTTADNIDNLFARNERLVCHFDTEIGPMCVILVGALIVAGIETVWAGDALASKTRHIVHQSYNGEIALQKGEEMGRFKLGSTVILLFPEGSTRWLDHLSEQSALKMGQVIGDLTP